MPPQMSSPAWMTRYWPVPYSILMFLGAVFPPVDPALDRPGWDALFIVGAALLAAIVLCPRSNRLRQAAVFIACGGCISRAIGDLILDERPTPIVALIWSVTAVSIAMAAASSWALLQVQDARAQRP